MEGLGFVQIITDPGGPKPFGCYGSGWPKTSVPDPWHFGTDPDPWLLLRILLFSSVIFKMPKIFFSSSSFFAYPYYFLKVHLHHSSRIKPYGSYGSGSLEVRIRIYRQLWKIKASAYSLRDGWWEASCISLSAAVEKRRIRCLASGTGLGSGFPVVPSSVAAGTNSRPVQCPVIKYT